MLSRYRLSTWVVIALLMLSALAAGCGDDSDEESSGSSESSSEGGGDAAEDKPVSIALFLLASANTYSQANVDGAEAQAEQMGDVDITVFDGGFDASKQLTQITDAAASGKYDAFLIAANSGAALAPAASDALEQGIEVVAMYEALGPDPTKLEPQIPDLTSSVLLLPNEQAERVGPAVVEACEDKDPCEIGYIGNGFGTPSENIKFKAFKASIAGESNIKIVGVAPEGGFLRDKGLAAAQNLLQAHPEIDGFVTSADQTTLGAEQAVNDAGREGEVFLTGLGCSTPGVKAMQEGRWLANSCSLPFSQAEKATEIAVNAVRGEEIPESERAISVTDLPAYPGGATKEDLEGYEAQWAG